MNKQEIMIEVGEILAKTKTAILATADQEGRPHMRWMSPALLPDNNQALYAVTHPGAPKLQEIRSGQSVEWMFQPRTLDTVVTLSGRINIIENPSLNAQLMETLARRLNVFWKVNHDETDFVVLETIIEEATWFKPMQGKYEKVKF